MLRRFLPREEDFFGLFEQHAALTVEGSMWGLMAIGLVTSGVVGYLTVKYLLRFLAANRLDVFAWYRLALAAATVIWIMIR